VIHSQLLDDNRWLTSWWPSFKSWPLQAKQRGWETMCAPPLPFQALQPDLLCAPAHKTLDPACLKKNIRRRVYDALNVLMAMDIITKEKKEIRWVGLPTNSRQDLNKLEARTPHSPFAEWTRHIC